MAQPTGTLKDLEKAAEEKPAEEKPAEEEPAEEKPAAEKLAAEKLAREKQDLQQRARELEEQRNFGDKFRSRFAAAFQYPEFISNIKDTAYFRRRNTRLNYQRALSKGCHFFILFVLCTPKRIARDAPKQFERLMNDPTSYQFSLDQPTILRFQEWAIVDKYDTIPSFVDFIAALGQTNSDLKIVKSIIRLRGLQGTRKETEILQWLFPECKYTFFNFLTTRAKHNSHTSGTAHTSSGTITGTGKR